MNARVLPGESLMAALVDAAMDAVVVLDADTHIEFVNRAAERLFGAPAADLVGQPGSRLVPERYIDAYTSALDRLDGIGIGEPTLPGTWRIEALHADGTEFPVEVSVARDRANGRWRHVLILRDVSGRLRAETALRESESRFRSLADHAPIMIWECGPDGAVHYFNKASLEFSGVAMGRKTGEGWIGHIHPEDREAILVPYREAVQLRRAFVAEYRYRRRDGQYRWVRAAGTPRFAPGGTFLGLIGTTADIDDWKCAEERMLRLNEELETRVAERTAELTAANAELEAFSYTVAHDLRAPLRAITGFTAQLSRRHGEGLPDDGRKCLERVLRSSRRLDRMIADLLAVARVGLRQAPRDVVDLAAQAAAVVDEIAATAYPRPAVAMDPLPQVLGDRTQLRQALQNLIANAVKFSAGRERPVIEIRGGMTDNDFVITVSDNGAGFDMASAGKLFGMFQRLHTEAEFEGTGVGLAIVRRIAARHGGRVWAESREDEGAAFHLAIPRERLAEGSVQ